MVVVISRAVTDVQILEHVTTQQRQFLTINLAHIQLSLTIVTTHVSTILTEMVIAMNLRYMDVQIQKLAITRRVLPSLMKAVPTLDV